MGSCRWDQLILAMVHESDIREPTAGYLYGIGMSTLSMSDTDIQTIEVTSEDEMDMEVKAKAAAEILSKHYPLHIWAVGWAPGQTLVIKNMAMDGRYGFTIDCTKSYSASDLAHTVMLAGGELLERCGMKRGKWDGEFAAGMEKN